jgi:hypothetical protein
MRQEGLGRSRVEHRLIRPIIPWTNAQVERNEPDGDTTVPREVLLFPNSIFQLAPQCCIQASMRYCVLSENAVQPIPSSGAETLPGSQCTRKKRAERQGAYARYAA